MDYETVSAEVFGASLRGIGLNLLVRDAGAECALLETAFDMIPHRVPPDFGIVTYGKELFQLHSDGTYSENPLLNLLPENPPRGPGIEIRLYDTDPDIAAARAEGAGGVVLQEPTDKPNGLRETYILCENGYARVASRPISGQSTA